MFITIGHIDLAWWGYMPNMVARNIFMQSLGNRYGSKIFPEKKSCFINPGLTRWCPLSFVCCFLSRVCWEYGYDHIALNGSLYSTTDGQHHYWMVSMVSLVRCIQHNPISHIHLLAFNDHLVGGIPTPLKNDGLRQLGWWHSQLHGKS